MNGQIPREPFTGHYGLFDPDAPGFAVPVAADRPDAIDTLRGLMREKGISVAKLGQGPSGEQYRLVAAPLGLDRSVEKVSERSHGIETVFAALQQIQRQDPPHRTLQMKRGFEGGDFHIELTAPAGCALADMLNEWEQKRIAPSHSRGR